MKETEYGEELVNEAVERRLGLIGMIRGLGAPRQSRAYREARIELERLGAPLAAVLLPALFAVVLFVVTAAGDRTKRFVPIDIVTVDEPGIILDEPPPPPPEIDAAPTDASVEIDVPMPNAAPEIVEAPLPPASEVATVKPLLTTALSVPSSVKIVGVHFDTRGAGARQRYLGDVGGVYGDVRTEGAVLKALRWLKWKQRKDGSWAGPSSAAMTGLAVLTYLAHGETPGSREFGGTVAKALDHLIAAQYDDKGVTCFRGSDGNEYAFLIATYALCEAYGMTRNPNAGEAARKGLARIVAKQSPTGGWDYKLNRASTRDDLSFGGWALQAVKAGRMAGLEVAGLDECVKRAVRCLKTRSFRKDGFGYCAGGAPTGLTATGCLALQLLGFAKEKEVRASLARMRDWMPVWSGHPGGANAQYYSYYATQCKYQAGMRKGATPADVTTWKKWNAAMKSLYLGDMVAVEEMVPDAQGHPRAMAYWQNKDIYKDPVMGTCLCALQLMVYYRYLPTSTLKATEVTAYTSALTKDLADEISVTIDI